MSIGIIGGGLSGITLQYLLKRDSEILEKENRIGGLCRTFQKDGFYYDIGGHILFSKDNNIMNFVKTVLDKNINSCKRINVIFFKNRFIKYPFENGLGSLDKEDIFNCLIGYIKNDNPKPKNFKEWIYYTFGNGIANNYLIPYNEKIWKTSLEKMSLEWVERVPKPPIEDLVKSSLGIETEGYLHQLYFNYPAWDGIEGLIKALVKDNSKLTVNYDVNRIYKENGSWMVSNGVETKDFNKIVLTMPINEAIKLLDNVPYEVQVAADALQYNSVRVIMIGLNDESLMDKSAIYIPSIDVIAHRICYMGYFSKNNVPNGKSSIIAEITTNKEHKSFDLTDEELVSIVIDDLDKVGIIDKTKVIATDIKNIKYGYVVYDLDYHKNIKIIRDYVEKIGIILHGRFSEFEYINMDEVIRRSISLATKLNEN